MARCNNHTLLEFVDWTDGRGWDFGAPPKSADGGSSIIDMHCFGHTSGARRNGSKVGLKIYTPAAHNSKQPIKEANHSLEKVLGSNKMLYADTKDKTSFSQHANALAILTGVVSDADKLAFSKG